MSLGERDGEGSARGMAGLLAHAERAPVQPPAMENCKRCTVHGPIVELGYLSDFSCYIYIRASMLVYN